MTFKKTIALMCAAALVSTVSVAKAALNPLFPSTSYSITLSKLNSNGTVTDIETTSATTDSNGKLNFTLTSVPTKDEVNFIVLTLKDRNSTVVRKAIMPAPPLADANKIGVNDLATKQADTILLAAASAGSDDPILVTYELVILRSPNITPLEAEKLAALGKAAIIGAGSNTFEGYLLSKGVTNADLTKLKKCLVYNPDPTKKTLREFGAGFYNAVRGVDATGATIVPAEELQKTGGLMADIFIDAASCANVDLSLIQMAHEAAGNGADSSGALAAMGANTVSSIDQSMSAFNRKLSMIKVGADYTDALTALGASSTQITRFLDSVSAMATSNANIDKLYGGFYSDPNGYATANSTTIDAVKTAMDAAYQSSWSAFQAAVASTDGEIAVLKAAIVQTNPGLTLPPDFGGYTDQSGARINWPLPQTVMVAWLATLDSFNYAPRDTTAIPAMQAMWMGTCSVNGANTWNQAGCVATSGVWTPGRRNYTTQSATFNAYLALQEDVNIVDMAKNSIWSSGNQPTQQQRQDAQEQLLTNLDNIKNKLSGSKSAVALTDSHKGAIIRLMIQPNM